MRTKVIYRSNGPISWTIYTTYSNYERFLGKVNETCIVHESPIIKRRNCHFNNYFLKFIILMLGSNLLNRF